MTTPHLAFVDVHKQFGARPVLCGVDLQITRGDIHFVLGPSGTGKSVLIKHAVGLVAPDAGQVLFDGKPVTTQSAAALMAVRARCQLILQAPTLFDQFDILNNVALPLRMHPSMRRSEALERAHAALQRVQAGAWARQMPHALSAGAQKRVALARALVLEPQMLLYDEPTTGLDPIAARATDDLIALATRDLKITALVVSHDLVSVRRVAQRVSFLHGGRIVASSAPDAFFASELPSVRAFVRGPTLAFD